MASTTAKAFDEFNELVTPGTSLREKVDQRKAAVIGVLKAAFPSTADIQHQSTKVIGSFGRNTASLPVDDIDLMAHLHVDSDLWSKSYSTNSADFLYRVRSSLSNASTVRKIGARGQAVRIFYADGLIVDVAAVVKYTTGGYGIPDGSGGWLTTDPVQHESYLNERNSAVSGNLKKFIRIVKQWNKAHSGYLASFHLEMLAARTFNTLGNNTREALKTFFDYNHYNLSVSDPAGYSGDLSTYLTQSARDSVNRNIKAAFDRAALALDAENRGDHAEAMRQWRIVLGSSFPAYG
ncbi:SMODS domain-containing nucleotidyltransferase [Saccharothrix deserti]|uniref:SMODS domain-containing nucleotidyltransferase n=1 Tax=Saccharothrix deserti TaxID=2593674 RepID=UPI00131E7976|nr:hypothetical protein [Saccharothrix deserti]